MAVDPLQPVSAGDSLYDVVTAGRVNALTDAARRQRANTRTGAGDAIRDLLQTVRLKVRNNTGAAIPLYGVVGLGILLDAPASSGDIFTLPYVVNAVAPSAGNLFGIAQADIANGYVGEVVVMGVTACKLAVNDASHTFASPTTSTTELSTGATGQCRIIWKESGTGSGKRAVVLMQTVSQGITSIVGQDGIRVTTSGGTRTLDLTHITPDSAQINGGSGFCSPSDFPSIFSVDTKARGQFTDNVYADTRYIGGAGIGNFAVGPPRSVSGVGATPGISLWWMEEGIGDGYARASAIFMYLRHDGTEAYFSTIPWGGTGSDINAKRYRVNDTLYGATGTDPVGNQIAGGIIHQIGSGSGGGGVTDHGALTGLSDDDHPQYFNQTRGDARYSQLGHTHPLSQLQQSGATTGQLAQWNGFQWVPATIASGTPPVGSILAMAANVMMVGYLPCDGAAVSRVMFSALFGAIGVIWGAGDGVNTFNVPDFRGRAPIGDGQGAGLSNRVLGTTGGAETHTLTFAQLPTNVYALGLGASTPVGGGAAGYSGAGGQAHNNMQPWAAVKYFIKT